MVSKIILVVLAILSMAFGSWAAMQAFTTEGLTAQLGLMGFMGSLLQSVFIIASLWFPTNIRKKMTLLLLAWHVPEALLIAIFGMGIPAEEQTFGIILHSVWSILVLIAWKMENKPESKIA